MNHFDTTERLYKLHDLIQQEGTGPPVEFANRLHISRRQLYNMIDELKDRGVSVEYSRNRKTFFYKNDFDITVARIHLINV